MPNQFAQLFSGLAPKANTPKFKFLQNYGTSNPMTGYAPKPPSISVPKQSTAPVGGMSTPSNTGATAPQSSTLSTPAAKQFVASQVAPTQPTLLAGNLNIGTPPPQSSSEQPITGNVQTPSGATINATSGATVNSAPVDPKASYRAAFDSYMATLNPSSAETAATKNLSDLTLQAKKDQETALNRGETQGFASGEAARVNRNNAFGIEAASNALDSFSNNRTSQTAAQKDRLDFEKSLLDDNKGDIQKIGNDIVRIGADGTAEKIYTGAPDVKTQIVQAGGKNILINSDTGAVIKELGATEGALTRGNSSGGNYTPGANPTVDSWVQLIQNGSAKITNVPAGIKNSVANALSSSGNNASTGGADTTELGKKALTTAQGLLDKFNSGTGNGAVGAKGPSSLFGLLGEPISGTSAADFVVDFNALKSQLSLEGVKYLKGQGAVSDAERALLANATSKLSRSQSEGEFKKSLQDIVDVLQGKGSVNTNSTAGTGDPEYDSYLQAIGQQ